MPIIFYMIPDYKVLQTSVASFETIMFCLLFFVIPESPRWLLTHDKFDAAHDSLSNAARKKGLLSQSQVDSIFESLKENTKRELSLQKSEKKPTILDVMKMSKLRNLSFILYFTWFTHSFIYYGSIFNIGNMGGNVFTNFIVFGSSYSLSNVLLLILINRFGRRPLLIFMTCLETVAFLGLLASSFSESFYYVRVLFSFLAVIGVSCGFNIIYVYTSETFPTTMRQVSIGTCSVFARIGSGISPFIKELTLVTHLSVSMGIFALLALLNALLVSRIPETKGKQLPDTLLQTVANCQSNKDKETPI